MSWTDERTETLKRMWTEGASANVIARELGGVTRNAVCGKIDRLKLSKRGTSNLPRHPKHKSAKPAKIAAVTHAAVVREVRETVPVDDLTIPEAQRKTILNVAQRECRWPVNHPGDPDFFLCGAPTAIGQPYCAGHLRRAWSTPQQRKVTRPWIPGRAA